MSTAGNRSFELFEPRLRETIPAVSFQPGMSLDEIERVVILETLRHQRFNRTRAARVLGIGIRTLQRKLKQYQSLELSVVPNA